MFTPLSKQDSAKTKVAPPDNDTECDALPTADMKKEIASGASDYASTGGPQERSTKIRKKDGPPVKYESRRPIWWKRERKDEVKGEKKEKEELAKKEEREYEVGRRFQGVVSERGD